MASDTLDAQAAPAGPLRRVARGIGMVLVWAGGTVLLYVVWLLWFTGIETARVQDDLLDDFDGFAAAEPAEVSGDPTDDPVVAGAGDGDGRDVGAGLAVLEFERPGSQERPVRDEPVVIVEGTTYEALTRGPGHYVTTAMPGGEGNFAVAGHRTTNGQPFYDLDQVRPGDLMHVTDRDGVRHTYEVLDGSSGGGDPGQHIVRPNETWVLGPDPLGTGGDLLTLTTCHPRFSATHRMVVFGQLVGSS